MSVCLFLTFRTRSGLLPEDVGKLDAVLSGTPNLEKVVIHTSSSAEDPYVKDHAPPQLLLQVYFEKLPDLEAAVARTGHLAVLASPAEFPDLAASDVSQQAMVVRPFAVPDPVFRNPPGSAYCTYLVSYEGEAQDLNAWHSHYLEKHTKHMARFPGIRELEVYTRLDWVSGLPWSLVNFMQRNKVAFDGADGLTQALNSPVRHEMRADYKTFPPFTGPNRHYAMATRVLHPKG
jgi:hypothetical protein